MRKITRDQLTPQDSPQDGWQIIEAAGQHPHTLADGTQLLTLVDDAAVAAIVAAGCPPQGILVDSDHHSHDMEKSTEALAWCRELAACPNEQGGHDLAAFIEYTSKGMPLIKGKVFKHFSTEYKTDSAQDLGGGKLRPTRLTGLAFTNRPNNAGARPITNRAQEQQQTQKISPSDLGQVPNPKQNTPPNNQIMTITDDQLAEIRAKLGLDDTADGAAIIAGIDAVLNAAAEADEAAAEEIIANTDTENELDEEEKEFHRDAILQNREKGIRILNRRLERSNAAKGKTQAIHNRMPTGRPRQVLTAGKGAPKSQLIANRAREMQAQGLHGKDWTKCYNAAVRECRNK